MRACPGWQGLGSCREFLDAARDAAEDIGRTERRLALMREGEGVRGAPLTGSVGGGSADPSGMSRVDARIDLEASMARRVEEDRALVADLRELCYGPGPELCAGGVAALRSRLAADVVWLRFGCGCSWADVAASVGLSVRWCQQTVAVTCEIVDAFGFERAVAGAGHATDD